MKQPHEHQLQASQAPEPGKQGGAHEHDDHDHGHPHDDHDDHDHNHPHDEHDHDHGHPHDDHDHGHPHDDHDHDHSDHDHGHDHAHASGLRGLLGELFHSHSHSEPRSDRALESSERGIWALKVSLAGLLATAIFQVVIVLISGSAALLADTIHNFADALTAVPLWIAFAIGRRPPTRRYTYGFRRAEDLAGIFIVLVMLASAALAAWESFRKLIDPQPLSNVYWVMAAAVVGFLGNELVAIFRIRVGREIGSAALEADGLHARTDGLTSLAVLVGALGVLLGFPQADPIVGLLITLPILQVVWGAAKTIWERLMDAVDPALVDAIERGAQRVEGVRDVYGTRVRWLGHNLEAELYASVDGALSTVQSHAIAIAIEHALLHDLPRLETVTIHIDPVGANGEDFHAEMAHHRNGSRAR
ncbi:MAG TPA: cation diffusion facilitator family transporter [Kouleothrix sp.]|uniref:cation diffusion facilitator family transporter n=1 Tax=Kouleothrix sp. TaxID=2779161 RepID=UPI002CBF4262|nr:cation diffusion facilitator family transporter [Kouleothrix sp.]